MDSVLSNLNLNGLCDLVVVEDYLIYFTRCFAESNYSAIKFHLEMKSGEIWVLNLKDNVMFRAAANLFFPKSISYVRSLDVVVVTNLAADGISLFKREADFTLTKLSEISLDAFVFNINVDNDFNVWLVLHPALHSTVDFFRHHTLPIASKLVKISFDFKNNRIQRYTAEEVFSTNGSLLDAVGSSVYFEHNLIIFSFVSDPKVCRLIT